MRRALRATALTVLLAPLSLCLGSPSAWGDCGVSQFDSFPAPASMVSPDTQIWFVNVIEPRLPHLRREDGGRIQRIPLVSVERREVNHVWWGRRLLHRHAPVQPLEPGVYWISISQDMGPDDLRRPIEFPFTVVTGAELPVPLPEVRGFRPGERMAWFDLWLPRGMLVADFGEEDEDPLESIWLERPRDGLHRVGLGSNMCWSNLVVTDCLRSRVRFGALSGAGKFSGWTGSYEVQFAGQNCAAAVRPAAAFSPVAPPTRPSSARSLWLPAAVAATALVAIALQRFRHRQRRN